MKRKDPKETHELTIITGEQEIASPEPKPVPVADVTSKLDPEPPSQAYVTEENNTEWIRDTFVPWVLAHQAAGTFVNGKIDV